MSLKTDNDARRDAAGITGGRRFNGGSSGGRTEWDRMSGDPLGYIGSGRAERTIGNGADTLGEIMGFGDRARTRDQRWRGQAERAEGSADRAEIRRREGRRELDGQREYDQGYAAGRRGDGRDYYREEGEIRDEQGPRGNREYYGPRDYDITTTSGGRDDRTGGDRDGDRRPPRYAEPGRGRVAGTGNAEPDTNAIHYATRDELSQIADAYKGVGAARSQRGEDEALSRYFEEMSQTRDRADGRIYVRETTTVRANGEEITIPAGDYSPAELTAVLDREVEGPSPIQDFPGLVNGFMPSRARGQRDRGDSRGGDRSRDDRNNDRDGDDRESGSRSAVPAQPSTSLEGGTGDLSLASDAYKNASRADQIKMLVNSRTVKDANGADVSNGVRASSAFYLITEELKTIQPGPAGMAQAGMLLTQMTDPTFNRNLEELYRTATQEERDAIRARADGIVAAAKNIDPSLEAPTRQGLTQMFDKVELEGRSGDGSDRSGDREAGDVDRAARLEALSRIQFADPESEAAKLWQTKLQQERSLNNAGGPFGAFFMQLFTMIGNVLSGKGELNQSAEEFLASHRGELTPPSQTLADELKAGRVPTGTDLPPPAPPVEPAAAAPGAPAAAPGTPAPAGPAAAPAAAAPAGAGPVITPGRADMAYISAQVTADQAERARASGGTAQTFDQLGTAPIINLNPQQQVNMKTALAGIGFDVGPTSGATDMTKVENSIKEFERLIGRTGAAVDGKMDAQLAGILGDREAMAAVKAARDAGISATPGGTGTTPPPTPAGSPAPAPSRQP